jgi:4'-phosphopantetheinyl transferase
MSAVLTCPSARIDGANLWFASLDEPTGEELIYFHSLLSAEEVERASRFHFERNRRRFIVGRGRLRTILGECVGCAPGELSFCYGPNGKPELGGALAGSPWRFNLAHADELVVYAIARDAELGVDVERLHDVPEWQGIAEQLFPSDEFRRLRATAPEERTREFFRIWTQTEARLKATGVGFGAPPAPAPGRERDVRLHSFCPAPRFAGALAILFSHQHT